MLPWNVHPKWSETGNTGVTGHLTQLLWAETEKVGCGFISFVDENGEYNQVRKTTFQKRISTVFGKLSLQWLGCNYYPGGNVNGQEIPVYVPDESPIPNCPP